MTVNLDELPEAKALLAMMSNLPGELPVSNEMELEGAADILRTVKALQKQADDARKNLTQPLDREKTRIMTWFRDNITYRLDKLENHLKRAIVAYQQEQERKRREEQRRADELARRERERLAKRAAAAEAKGQAEKAEMLAQQAETVVAPIAAGPAKVAGISGRSNWKFEITDPKLIPREFLVPDEKKIGGVVRAMKGDTNIPGVRVYEERGVAARS